MPPPVPQILAPSPKTVCYALRIICAKCGAFTQKCTIFAIFGANRPDYRLIITGTDRCKNILTLLAFFFAVILRGPHVGI